jgi:hypothetical protein
MWQFVINGACLTLHVKLEFTSLATCLASIFFASNSEGGGGGVMANVQISFVKYVQQVFFIL